MTTAVVSCFRRLRLIHGSRAPCIKPVLDHLLEDLAIRPIVLLAVDVDGLVPAPLVLDEFLIGGLVGIELCELVALPVRRDIEGGNSFVTTDHKGTANDGIIGFAVDTGGAEKVFAGRFETGEETTCERETILVRDH